ncbi:hypothetical protein BU26DRAFT_405693, partial [Trematosphaeria pertusa]
QASYFDLPPASSSKAGAASELTHVPDTEAVEKMGLLSPQVTRILEDKELEEQSSTEEEGSHSEEEDAASRDKGCDVCQPIRQQPDAPLEQPSNKHVRLAPPPSPSLGAGTSRHRHPHMARFHSLRSVLFSSKIEEDMKAHREAEDKWKAEHDGRRGLQRPKTPESPAKSPNREGFAHRMGARLKRMTSKEAPTLQQVKENPEGDGNESTASSEGEEDQRPTSRGSRAEDEEEINHSDIEDLMRWVSRRDPPSDGEARKSPATRSRVEEELKEDSGHESLGHSDVDDLVRWVSRRSAPGDKKAEEVAPSGCSDVSTESDSETEDPSQRRESIQDQDVDDIVRWISRREGPEAGPVRAKRASGASLSSSSDDSDTAEMVRWAKREDDTSGDESDIPAERAMPTIEEHPPTNNRTDNNGSSLKKEVPQAKERGKLERGLTHEDVDDLVRWVSRKNADAEQVQERDDKILEWRKEEDEKKAQ